VSDARRSALKTISWRLIATADTAVISWLITGSLAIAASIAGIEVVTKLMFYYLHERAWNKVAWGNGNGEQPAIDQEDNPEIIALINERMEIGLKRYGHGVRAQEDTRNFGTKDDTWVEMALEEVLDNLIYISAEIIRIQQLRDEESK
tara:strand:+ start:1934 stop:2377 length:444 start_codon:yes stop_codon:yes gene_type:complete